MLNQGVAWLASGYRPGQQQNSDNASIPESEDNIRISEEEVARRYPEWGGHPQPPPPSPTQRRAQSARARSLNKTEETKQEAAKFKRPGSARPLSAGRGVPKKRAGSAGTTRSLPVTPRQGRPITGYFIPKDPRTKLKIDFHPDPNHQYMDRHSRCFDTSHIHDPLLSYRPRPSCRAAWVPTGTRPGSSCSARSSYVDHLSKIQRYTDNHRPQTAPGTRKELQILTKSNFVVRGIKPHFCNFVQGVQLHERDINTQPNSRHGDGGDDNDDYDNGTVVESTDGISLGQWRHHRSSRSGTEGRPGSPSSVGDGLEDDMSSKLNTDALPRSLYGAKINTDLDGDGKDRLKANKENELRPYIQIPSPEPPVDPKPAWRDTVKKSSKGSTGKKGRQAGKSTTGGAGGAGGEGNGEDGGKKRSCIKKKDKKKTDRHRKSTMDSEPQVEPVTTIVEEKKTPEPEKTDADNHQADSKVPDLPSSSKNDKLREQRADRARRQQIEAEFLRSDLNELLMQEMRDHRKEFDFDADSMSDDALSKNRVRMSSWLTGRLALSQQSSRFTLPMDMKVLEKMTPQDYLRTYCVVSSRRHILYQKIHSKNRDKTGVIPFKDIEKALKDVLVNTISKEEVTDVCQLLEIDEETNIDYQLFCGVAAFAERILYPKFVTEDTAELPEFQREKIECADFCALDWKFHGVNVNPPVKKMLKSLG
ncbi:uncharacterized protein LOC124260208 isoform X2 [Haliotis rubra]|uniref:uncharacterized protein LOC124260208 isoform X2 n=1 Tax=Haliotis rubra TaxID=36100 RepID=UPI001EE5D4C6|nr:uncharacterized protein LOC124260208 isoform X2 [Haliotis rubra]